MADAAVASPARPPLWRSVRARRIAGQLVFLALVVVAGRELFLNLEFNAAARRQDLGFGFLDIQSGVPIADPPIEYSSTDRVSRAFAVGVVNTLRVSLLGIVLCSILGLLIGVARLSPNWLVRKLAQVYVEIIRNTPVPIQVLFWWAAVFLVIPTIENSVSIFGVAFVSNRGSWLPWVQLQPGAGAWGLFLAAAVPLAWLVRRWRTRIFDETGRPHRRFLWGAGTFLVIAALGYVLTGSPLEPSIPELQGRTFEGGVKLGTEFVALLLGLTIYTAAFIAEIVRGSIQAIPKGQREAAEALGLSRGQQLRYVILPQALRIAIPAVNSQYLNLLKNSSLGLLIGFPELLRVGRSIITGRGRETQVLLIIMLLYLVMSLSISFLMNRLNKAVTTKGAR